MRVLVAIVIAAAAASSCGSDDKESADAGPVDAGEPECQQACEDALSVEHLIDHLIGED